MGFDFFCSESLYHRKAIHPPKEREYNRQGLGSGVIVRKTGNKLYVFSNNHVAGDAEEINVRLYDGR